MSTGLVPYMAGREQRLAAAIPKGLPLGATQLIRELGILASATPALAACEPEGVYRALMVLAGLGLSPMRHAYLIPHRGSATLIIRQEGLIELAARAGIRVVSGVVREGDHFEIELVEGSISHRPSLLGEGETLAAYAVASVGGARWVELLTRADIAAIRAQSEARSPSSPWQTFPGEMARKAAIKRLLKRVPLAWTEHAERLAEAVEIDHGNAIAPPEQPERLQGVDAWSQLITTKDTGNESPL